MKVSCEIHYTDGEVVEKDFETLEECINYIKTEIIEKKEFADEIKIRVE